MQHTIWGYIGVIGSGKDYAANEKAKETGGLIFDFSDGVREFTFGFLGWRPETLEDYTEFKSATNCLSFFEGGELKVKEISGRKFLTNVGVTMRNYNKDFWANYTFNRALKSYKMGLPIDLIFGSVRYPNEALVMYNLAKLLHIDIKFIFTDYHSERYTIGEDESEHWAQKFLNKGCCHMEDITNIVLKDISNGQ